MNGYVKNRRSFAFLAAFFLAAVLFFSGIFLITQAKHDCAGEDCSVCREIQVCAAVIRLIFEAVGTGTAAITVSIVCCKLLSAYQAGLFLCPVSLVRLKIRLNN